MKICIPIAAKSFEDVNRELKNISGKAEMAELYMEEFDDETIDAIIHHSPLPLVCTAFISQKKLSTAALREGCGKLKMAIDSGADYIDLPFFVPQSLSTKVIQHARQGKTRIILSHHDFSGTPDLPALLKLAKAMKKRQTDLIKIACMAKSFDDTVRMVALARHLQEEGSRHCIIALGPKGRLSRILTPTLGGEMMFASLSKKDSMHGQLTVRELRKAWSLLSL